MYVRDISHIPVTDLGRTSVPESIPASRRRRHDHSRIRGGHNRRRRFCGRLTQDPYQRHCPKCSDGDSGARSKIANWFSRDRGSITAEFAAGMPILILFLVFALAAVSAARTKMACEDAAYIGAREAARGSDNAKTRASAHAPPGAEIVVRREGNQTKVTVQAKVTLLGPASSTGSASSGSVRNRTGESHMKIGTPMRPGSPHQPLQPRCQSPRNGR